MFQSARVQLTFWYVIVVMIISGIFSISFYQIGKREVERVIRRVEFEQQLQNRDFFSPVPRNFPSVQELEESRQNLKLTLIFINAFIFVTSGGIAYFLAGRTLKPIQVMVDEQSRFITDASHELRTPLTALRVEMEASLLEKNISDKKAKTLIQSNLEEILDLQKLSDNLLQLVQYEKQPQKQSFRSVSLLQTIEDALKTITPFAKNKKITITNEVDDVTFQGNQSALTQLFIILLDNAIKYSFPKKNITIKSKKIDHTIRISVTDKGIGIEEKDISHIFDRFYRADKSRTKSDVSGYGLGLSIANNIVKEHHGTITVKSTVDKGSTFLVDLPLK